MKSLLPLLLLILAACGGEATYGPETVTISGHVTDFDGNPIDNSIVQIKHRDFSPAYQTYTDKNGYYSLEVEKGRYAFMYVIRPEEYPRNNAVPTEDMRLEFWAWNLIADRDMTIDPRYHKLELYGTTVFGPIGGYDGLMIYFRPMSVTKNVSYADEIFTDKAAAERKTDVSVRPEYLEVRVMADGEELNVNSITPVEEFIGRGKPTITGYLVQVDAPTSPADKPYIVFRVEAGNTEYGERGENLYFYELPEYN
ncbi:MAG: carboxypeptidase-like regulatory domain-containing protein [Rikenellaceae bacterium]|nr:carboxypeptidase-like regulatory domain-containing protein [Rikenellaceae bacterium]